MPVATQSETWAKGFDGLPFFNEDGGMDVLDPDLAAALLAALDWGNAATLKGGGLPTVNPAAVAIREDWLREIFADIGIGSVEDIDNEQLEEILTDLLD